MRASSQRGVTLIELMISMVILSIAISTAFLLGASLKRSYVGQRRAIQTERTARSVLDYLSNAIRAASPAVPTGLIFDFVGCSPLQGISIADGVNASDAINLVWAAGKVTAARAPYNQTSTGIMVPTSSEFKPGDLVVISDLTTGHMVKVTGVAVSGFDMTLQTTPPITKCPGLVQPAYPTESVVARVQMGFFYVDEANSILLMDPDGLGPELPEPIGMGVEDMQIAIGADVNEDKVLTEDGSTTDEWFYNNPSDPPPPPISVKAWTQVRLTITARSSTEGEQAAQSFRPAAENRTAGGPDAFRRRTLATRVEVRNLHNSPSPE